MPTAHSGAVRVVLGVFLVLGGLMLMLGSPRRPAGAADPMAAAALKITPLELAQLHFDPVGAFRIIDLSRSSERLYLRGSLRVDPAHPAAVGQAVDFAAQSPLSRVVLVTDGSAPPEALLRALQEAGRRVAVLQGGVGAWQREILAPAPPAAPDEAARRDYLLRQALSQALQGRGVGASAPPEVPAAPRLTVPRQQRASGSSGC